MKYRLFLILGLCSLNMAGLLAGGRIVECGPAQQILDHPATPQGADFLAKVLKY